MVTIQTYIYAAEDVASQKTDNVVAALNELNNQVNFTVDPVVRTENYPKNKTGYSRDKTLDVFEDHVGSRDDFTEKDHFMLLREASVGGLSRFDLGQNTNQEYQPYTYAVSLVDVGFSTEENKNLAIHEFGHSVQDQYYGNDCPESDTNDHSCGEVGISSKDVSPMLTFYISEAANNNWAICSGDPEDYDGGHTTQCSSCAIDRMEDFVAYNV